MNRSIHGALIAVASLIVGCATLDTERERELLLGVDREWAATAAKGQDVEQIISFWSDNATVLPPGAPPIKGKAAIRAYVKESLAIPGFRIHWSPDFAEVSEDGTMGYTTGENQVTVPGPDGKLTTIIGRYTAVWRRDSAGDWKCVFDIWNSGP